MLRIRVIQPVLKKGEETEKFISFFPYYSLLVP